MSTVNGSLAALKYLPDDDNIRCKQRIKERLIQNRHLLHALHSSLLTSDNADDYIGTHIRFSTNIPELQDQPEHYILVTTHVDSISKQNEFRKYLHLQFLILADERDLTDTETGIERHDLLAAILKNEFGWSNLFGTVCRIASDTESAADRRYAARKLVYEMEMPRDLVKSRYYGNSFPAEEERNV